MAELVAAISNLGVGESSASGGEEARGTRVEEVSLELPDGAEPTQSSQTPARRLVLEDFVQCSQSHLWRLMMSFYDRKGPESWSQGIVPHFITCNAFIGRTYAKVLQGFLSDCQAKGMLRLDEPLYIVELGAGSGKFSFYMLRALEELQALSPFPFSKLVYVMTDFTQANFNFWQSHPSLRPYFDRGVLDAGIFNAVTDSTIHLWRSGKVLSLGCAVNPVCVVANYLFDTLCHDIFQVEGGQLKEGLVSVGSRNESEPDPLDPDIIQRLENEYRYSVIEPEYYFDEEGDESHLTHVLGWYREHFKDTSSGASFLLPIGALRAVRRLTRLSSAGTIVISGDKGNNSPDQFVGLADPYIAVHGSFSLMVNYHAIGLWVESRGGFALHNPQEEASLKVSSFFLPPTEASSPSQSVSAAQIESVKLSSTDFPLLSLSFRETCVMFGPNDFFVLQKGLKEDVSQPSLRSVISMLKLSDWDPDVFFKFRDVILGQTPTCGSKLRNDISRGIARLWENYFMLDVDKDIAFEIGRFYYGIRDYDNALRFYEESISGVGEHHITLHNQGLCFYSQGKLETALSYFSRSLSLNERYEKARNWVDKVKKEMEQSKNTIAVEPSNGIQDIDIHHEAP